MEARRNLRRAMQRSRLLPAILIVAAALAFACGGEQEASAPPGPEVTRAAPQGAPRQLQLGLGAQARARARTAWLAAFAHAGRYAEIVRIARVPPWEEFLPGAEVTGETHALTLLERALVRQYGLTLLFAIDPTDGAVQRGRIADLPDTIDPGEGFLRADVQEALVAYAVYVATNYEPEYLAIGVEINMLRARAPDQFEGFLSAYARAYDAVKAVRPATKVFPTFQLEDLEGALTRTHPPQWEALEAFAGRMDALAISTYPYLTGIRSAGDIRADHYRQLRERFTGEILISEAGYASAPVEGHALVGTQRDQELFLERLLNDAEENGFSAVVWGAPFDPAQRRQGGAAVLNDVGLRLSDGAHKQAWATWAAWALRPVLGAADGDGD